LYKINEILVRVCATPVNYGDLTARDFAHSQFNMPAPLYLPARMVFGKNPRQWRIRRYIESGGRQGNIVLIVAQA